MEGRNARNDLTLLNLWLESRCHKKPDPDSSFSLDFGCLYVRYFYWPPHLKPVNFYFPGIRRKPGLRFITFKSQIKSFFSLTFRSKFLRSENMGDFNVITKHPPR